MKAQIYGEVLDPDIHEFYVIQHIDVGHRSLSLQVDAVGLSGSCSSSIVELIRYILYWRRPHEVGADD